jgi:hypothetical protein
MLVHGMSVCGTVNDEGTIWMTEESWLDSQQGPGMFLFSTLSSPALGLIHPPIQWILETVFQRMGQWLDSQQGPGTFLFSTLSSPAVRLIHPPIQWILEAVFPRVGQPSCEAGSVPLLPLRREKDYHVWFVLHIPLLYYLVSAVKNKL